MTLKEWMCYLSNTNEHYEVSDEFVKVYQQKDGEYIKYARKTGHVIDCEIAEPNQKWHFFESLVFRSLAKGTYKLEDDAKMRYEGLKCPELLLWIAEASGIDKKTVLQASQKVKEIIEAGKVNGRGGYARNDAGREITHNIIGWEMIEEAIKKSV